MKSIKTKMIVTCLAAGVITTFLGINSAHAQLLVNFQASSFNATNDTLTDSVNGIIATAAGTAANTQAANGAIDIGSGFTFNADSVPGLDGLTSYTLAVGFTYNGGAGGGANAYQGQGAFGGDLPGGGDGDANLAVTSDSAGQIVGSLGATDGNDYSVYNTANAGNFVEGQPTGAVLVVNKNTESLYVDGQLINISASAGMLTLPSTVTFSPFGNLGGNPTTTYAFGIGTNTNGTTGNNPLNGDITQAQIYGSALSASDAEALSLNVAAVPEPSSVALLASGAILFICLACSRSLVKAKLL